MTTILGILAGVAGILAVFFRSKANSSEALLENNKTNQEILELDKQLAKNEGLLEAEEAKREELQKEVKDVSKEDLIDFVNNLKPKQ